MICHRSLPTSCLCSCCSCPKTLRTSAMAEISMSLDRTMLMADKGYHIDRRMFKSSTMVNQGLETCICLFQNVSNTPTHFLRPSIATLPTGQTCSALPMSGFTNVTTFYRGFPGGMRCSFVLDCLGTGERSQLTCPDVEIGNYETEN